MPYQNQLSIRVSKKAKDDWITSLEGMSPAVLLIRFLSFVRFAEALLFPDPQATSSTCRYMSVVICLMRGFFILAVLTRCDSPISARAAMIAASALIRVSTAAMPFKMSDECAQAFLTDFAWRSM